MAKTASLPFTGSRKHVQGFGGNAAAYARFGLAGHDGDDWLMPEGTPLYAPVSGKVLRHGEDPSGWGKYIQVWDSGQKLLINIAHCSGLQAITGAYVRAGEQIAFSGNTGNSSAPHVHVAAADTDDGGGRLNQGNGYKGWYSILDGSRIALVSLPTGSSTSSSQATDAGSILQSGDATAPITFDTIYSQYYAGWEKNAARDDFNTGKHGSLDELLAARGIAPDLRPPKERPEALKKKYLVGPQYTGFSIKELVGPVLKYGRADLLARYLGLSENDVLTRGQWLDPSGFDKYDHPDSGEWKAFEQLTSSTPIGVPGNYYIREEYAGQSFDSIDPAVPTGRRDILAGFLGVPENMIFTRAVGFGTSGFPPAYIPKSSEWEGFLVLFEQLPTAPGAPVTEDISEDDIGQAPPTYSTQGAQQQTQYPTITIYSSPERAKIYIDELYIHDLTPSNKAYPSEPGSHTVRVEKSGYLDYTVGFDLGPSEQKVISATLKPFAGTVGEGPQPVTSGGKYSTKKLTRLVNELYEEVFHRAPV